MSGVTTSRRTILSTAGGMRTLEWLNNDVALSSTSKASTATAGAPSAATTANLMSMERTISTG